MSILSMLNSSKNTLGTKFKTFTHYVPKMNGYFTMKEK